MTLDDFRNELSELLGQACEAGIEPLHLADELDLQEQALRDEQAE